MCETPEKPVSPQALALAKAIMGQARDLGEVIANEPLIGGLGRFKELCQDPDLDKLLIALAEKSRAMARLGPGLGLGILRSERAGTCEAIGALYGAKALQITVELCRILDKLYSREVEES